MVDKTRVLDKPDRVPRFHIDVHLAAGATLPLPAAAAHHAAKVLRLREGDRIALFTGSGGEFSGRIAQILRDRVTVVVGAFDAIERESPLEVTLLQGISSGDRMDLTIQKAVELGAAAIQPLLAERSIVRLKGDRGDSRREHWQRVAASACEQCGRNRVPPVATAIAVGDYQAHEGSLKLMLALQGTKPLRSAHVQAGQPILLAVGPEAGFSPREEGLFIASGFIPVGLGPRTLRTETAGPAALSALNALFGDS